MPAILSGIVLRSKDMEQLTVFYAALGIRFNSHSHGGPIHAQCQAISDDFVVEIYKASGVFSRDAVIIATDSLAESLAQAELIGAPVLQAEKESPDGFKFAYIGDPDGRPVLLLETKPQKL